MTDWTPPLATGLARGDRRVEDALRPHVDTGDLADCRQPGVYCLTCSTPADRDYADVWAEHYDAPHPDLGLMESLGRIAYVGAAKDVFARVTEHAEGDVKQAVVPSAFPVHDVQTVWWYQDVEDAFARESGHAIELRNMGTVYVSQN